MAGYRDPITTFRRRLWRLGVGRVDELPSGEQVVNLARDRIAVHAVGDGYVELHDFHLHQRYWVGTAQELSDRLAALEVGAPDGVSPDEFWVVFEEPLPEPVQSVG